MTKSKLLLINFSSSPRIPMCSTNIVHTVQRHPYSLKNIWLGEEVTLTEILILPAASGSAVPEILISIVYLTGNRNSLASYTGLERSLHITSSIPPHFK